MRRAKRRLFNLFAFSILAFAIYLNFFYKEEEPGLLKEKPNTQPASKTANAESKQAVVNLKN